jgi:hypothetical protein
MGQESWVEPEHSQAFLAGWLPPIKKMKNWDVCEGIVADVDNGVAGADIAVAVDVAVDVAVAVPVVQFLSKQALCLAKLEDLRAP